MKLVLHNSDGEVIKEMPMGKQTNEEWFCGLSTERKAEWLFQHGDCIGCPAKREICHRQYDDCKTAFLEWLKEIHNDNLKEQEKAVKHGYETTTEDVGKGYSKVDTGAAEDRI